MVRLLFILLIFLIGCVSTDHSKKITYSPSPPIKQIYIRNENTKKINELKLKVAQLETEIENIKKQIDKINKKMDKLIAPDSSINEDTKTLILSKISELSAKQENYLMYLSNINKELSDIKEKISSKNEKRKIHKKIPLLKKKKVKKTNNEENFYTKCFMLYKEKKFDNSISCFEDFVKKYKKSRLLSNAYFWIGENYFKKGDFLKAIDNYDIVLTKFPKSKKVPSALLKEGLAFYYMKDKEGSKIFLQKVINEYPTSPQAYYAKRFIEKFKLK